MRDDEDEQRVIVRVLFVPDGYVPPDSVPAPGHHCARCGSTSVETIPPDTLSLTSRVRPWFREHDWVARLDLIELGVIPGPPDDGEIRRQYDEACYCYVYQGTGAISYAPQHYRAAMARLRAERA